MKAFKGGAILAAKSGGRMFHIGALLNPNFVRIVDQLWSKKNYDITTTALGFVIPNITNNATWTTSTTLYNNAYAAQVGTVEEKTYAAVKAAAMWRYYADSAANGEIYGVWYNWYAIKLIQMDIDYFNANNLNSIVGVRVPVRLDYDITINHLGGESVAGGKMKEVGLTYFNTPNTGATNESGFGARGAGVIWDDGAPNFLKGFTYLATLTLASGSSYRMLQLKNDNASAPTGTTIPAVRGVSFRMIKDITYQIPQWTNKIWGFIGDSISEIYPAHVLADVRLTPINAAVAGTTMAGTGTASAMWQDLRINLLQTNTDLVTILAGTNDWSQGFALGTIDSTDTNTFYGAYNVAINKITARCPDAIIMLFTTTYGQKATFVDQRNTQGLLITDYSQAVRNIASNRGTELLDLEYLLGWNASNFTTYISDLLHPNMTGAIEIKKLIITKLRSLIPN